MLSNRLFRWFYLKPQFPPLDWPWKMVSCDIVEVKYISCYIHMIMLSFVLFILYKKTFELNFFLSSDKEFVEQVWYLYI